MIPALSVGLGWEGIEHYYLRGLGTRQLTRLCDMLSETPQEYVETSWYSSCFVCQERMYAMLEAEHE